MLSKIDPSCVACGSKDLCFGYLGGGINFFIPSNIFTVNGFKTRSYVCLNCGFITQYISQDKLEKIKKKMGDKLNE